MTPDRVEQAFTSRVKSDGPVALAGNAPEARSHSVEGYAASLASRGIRVLPGARGTFWVPYETCAMMRIPEICLDLPSKEEIDGVLWCGPALVASYLRRPSEDYPLNAWLYLCRDKRYSLEALSVPGRRDARRAIRNLQFGFLEWSDVFSQGFSAYSQTRRRIGLSDDTCEHFHKRFLQFAAHPGHCAIGAWREDRLVAFMTLIAVDDWVAIEGSFSEDESRTWCPNDGLSHFVLEEFLRKRHITTVSYGLSSIQEGDQAGGLHSYKKKVGFEPQPVHRAFVLHALARPFANRLAARGVTAMRGLFPRSRLMKKVDGVLGCVIGKKYPSA